MRIFSYRNKRAVRRVVLIVLGVLLALLLLLVCRFIFLGRYVVYADGAVHFDYTQKLSPTGNTPDTPDPAEFPFETVLDVQAESPDGEQPMQQLTGYYISTRMLADGVDAVREALDETDDYNAVVIDVKSIYGNFYYSTELAGATTASADVVDITQVDALIKDLTRREGLAVIARVPAFSDPVYALAHQSEGLPLYSGALWTDDNGCYWLNPYSNGVQGYLSSIALELSQLGFDEVLFDNFYFPDSDRIAWTSDDITRDGAVLDAAQNIKDNLFGNGIRVCFGTSSPSVAAFADRIFVSSDEPDTVAVLAESMQQALSDTASQIVFLTDSRDTRFETCGVVRLLLQKSD